MQYVGSFPNGFPNTPGRPATPSNVYDFTEKYTNIDLQTGLTVGGVTTTFYVENVGNSDAVVYIQPEAFAFSRYVRPRPRTFGVRVNFGL